MVRFDNSPARLARVVLTVALVAMTTATTRPTESLRLLGERMAVRRSMVDSPRPLHAANVRAVRRRRRSGDGCRPCGGDELTGQT
jgi:hypothetical protein